MARIKHGTLSAATVATVDIDDNVSSVEVINVDGASPIYFRLDGQNPTVAGDDCEVVPAATGAALKVDAPATVEVRLISAGTPKYCVRGE